MVLCNLFDLNHGEYGLGLEIRMMSGKLAEISMRKFPPQTDTFKINLILVLS